jgi:hypothetical protein
MKFLLRQVRTNSLNDAMPHGRHIIPYHDP